MTPDELRRLNVRDFLESAVERNADAPLLIWEGTETSYRDFDNHVNKAARVWHDAGLRHGDRVAFMLDNAPEFLYAWLGAAKLGGILVAINTGFREDETRYLITDSEARFALVGQPHLATFTAASRGAPALERTFGIGPAGGLEDFVALSDAATLDAPVAELAGDDVISLIYTSGTTGKPKGVMQTHRNYVLTGQAYPAWMGMERGDRIYACLPLFHINSQSYSMMGSIGAEGAIVLAPRFSASRFWDHIRRYRVNVFNFIGAMTVILSKSEPSPADRDHVVKVAYGVPALPHELRLQLEDRYGMKVVSGFGMSETTFGLLEPPYGERRPGSMGKERHHPDPSVPRTEARIVDDDGREVPPGEVGELILRNPALMVGYYGDPERTAEALRDGWLYTGDMAWRDEDGFFYFSDRKKDIVRRRGENVSSLEVELVLNEHPGVLESAIVGVPSELTDEELLAVVVRQSGADPEPADLIAWCAARLAPFKVPRFVTFVDKLPKTPTQKIEKHRIRDGWDPSRADYDREVERAR
jgi:crotonobetaine/carnitine-CoA ligase